MKHVTTDNNEFLPDGVTPNPNVGKVTEVNVPDPPTIPLFLSATAFQDVCEEGLGGGVAGRARFGAVERAMSVSADDEVRSVFKRYDKSTTFDKPKTTALLTLLVSKGIVTNQERAAILAAWPEA